jgi:hypothetical protein
VALANMDTSVKPDRVENTQGSPAPTLENAWRTAPVLFQPALPDDL